MLGSLCLCLSHYSGPLSDVGVTWQLHCNLQFAQAVPRVLLYLSSSF